MLVLLLQSYQSLVSSKHNGMEQYDEKSAMKLDCCLNTLDDVHLSNYIIQLDISFLTDDNDHRADTNTHVFQTPLLRRLLISATPLLDLPSSPFLSLSL